MFIQRIRIEGFTGFEDSGWIELSPKLNVVIGTNNSGKSSLLTAASGVIPDNPHKSPERYLPGHRKAQRVHMDFMSTLAEFRYRLASLGGNVETWAGGPTVVDVEYLKAQVEAEGPIILKVEVRPGAIIENREPTFSPPSIHNVCIGQISMVEGAVQVGQSGGGRRDNTVSLYSNSADNAIFHFPAERYHRHFTSFGRYDKLNGDASNLAGFLQYLQGNNEAQFIEIITRLRQVIPSIEGLTIDTHSDGFHILIWPSGSGSNRQLAFSLETCGTGVSQVLAIFSAVVTKSDCCIIVDEINSFLHPLAVKDLLAILATEYSTNQYVISSHSSDVVAHPSVSSVIVVEREKFVSRIKTLDRDDLGSLKRHMRELGVSMADVLGADSIIWVEGPTESIAFPNLFRDYLGGLPSGMQVVAVSATGDFEGTAKDKKAITRIYERFMQVAAPLATGQAFLLDRESLSDSSVTQIERNTDQKLRFLGRRCLENYVLIPTAIVALLGSDAEFVGVIDEQTVAAAMASIAASPDIRGHHLFKGDLADKRWLRDVDGAKLLTRLFGTLSDNMLQFRKTLHTPILVGNVGKSDLDELLTILDERRNFARKS